MKKIQHPIMILTLLAAFAILLSACGAAGKPQGALAYMELVRLPQLPFEGVETGAVESLLEEIYIHEGDTCAFRSPGLMDGFASKMQELYYSFILAEGTGLSDNSFHDSVNRILQSALRELASLKPLYFTFHDAIYALCLEWLVSHGDNQNRINQFLRDHTDEKTGLLFEHPNSSTEDMIFDTAIVFFRLKRSGITFNIEKAQSIIEAYYKDYTFKLPGQAENIFNSGGDIIDEMAMAGMDISKHLSWWESWKETLLSHPLNYDSDLSSIISWNYIAGFFSDDTFQKGLNDYMLQTDLSDMLNSEDPSVLYTCLHDVLPELPPEKKEAVMERCRYFVKRFEEVLLAPTIRDSFYGASLAKATGFSVDWNQLLTCCSAMLEKEMSSDNQDLSKTIHALYYFGMLAEVVKDKVEESAYTSAVSLLKRSAETCIKKVSTDDGPTLHWDALRELCEMTDASGLANDKKFVQTVRNMYDKIMEFEDKDTGISIKSDSSLIEFYIMGKSCGFDKISTEDLQNMLSDLSIDGAYMSSVLDDPKVANLKSSYWISCLRTRLEALSFTAEELSMLSQQAALHFGSAMESPDLAEIYYYLCLKYCTAGTPGGTP